MQDRVPDDVALEAGLLGAAPADLDHRLEPGGGGPGRLEAVVGVVDVRLFGLEVGVSRQLPVLGTGGIDILPSRSRPQVERPRFRG